MMIRSTYAALAYIARAPYPSLGPGPQRAVKGRAQRFHSPAQGGAGKSTAARPLSATAFEPPLPPTSSGTPSFPDVDLAAPASPAGLARSSDTRAVHVVTGSNRGIGLEVARLLLRNTSGTVAACCRRPDEADALAALEKKYPGRMLPVELDLCDAASVERAAAAIAKELGRADSLYNVAGVLGGGPAAGDPGPERSLRAIDGAWMERSFTVNAIGPVLLVSALMPIMKSRDKARPPPIVANVSARVGSISDNGLGGWYSYRMSKAALNMATRTMAVELRRKGHCAALAFHPGTTETDLSAPFRGNVKPERLFPVEFSAGRLLDVANAAGEEHSGGFYDWAGKALPF
mmetsp:Transcript_22453/g.45016  ORF Transcript_22453/g.45016 Transcript_22453/m.45016 type:complete len:347 (-) Transcript_22453:306-1346(-)